jgi:hypothetical protein
MCAVARFQPAGAEWTVLVSRQLIAARLVPTKLLLIFHGTPKNVKAEYSYASHLLKDGFGLSLPEFVAGDTFVAFDKDWKARRLPLTGPFLRIGLIDCRTRLQSNGRRVEGGTAAYADVARPFRR